MKSDTINVGTKFGSEHFAVEVSIKLPENAADRSELCKNDAEFENQMFVRGWRIWNQEQSGARDYVKGLTVEQRKDVPAVTKAVQAIIDSADPTAPAKRTGRPAKPAEATVTADVAAAMKKGDTAKLAELLAAQGIKINFTK